MKARWGISLLILIQGLACTSPCSWRGNVSVMDLGDRVFGGRCAIPIGLFDPSAEHRYCLKGLPPGTYWLGAKITGRMGFEPGAEPSQRGDLSFTFRAYDSRGELKSENEVDLSAGLDDPSEFFSEQFGYACFMVIRDDGGTTSPERSELPIGVVVEAPRPEIPTPDPSTAFEVQEGRAVCLVLIPRGADPRAALTEIELAIVGHCD